MCLWSVTAKHHLIGALAIDKELILGCGAAGPANDICFCEPHCEIIAELPRGPFQDH